MISPPATLMRIAFSLIRPSSRAPINPKGRMRKFDRPPEALKVMPGLNAIVGRTRKEAEELHQFLQSKIHPDVGLELLSNQLGGFDLSEYDLDGPLPDIPNGNSHSAASAIPATSSVGRERKG